MLNSDITKLDQILTMRQSSKNRLGYTGIINTIKTTPKTIFVKANVISDVTTTSKIVFVKVAAKIDNTPVSGKNYDSLLPKVRKIDLCLFVTTVTSLVIFFVDALNI